jgi:hypothetical protein
MDSCGKALSPAAQEERLSVPIESLPGTVEAAPDFCETKSDGDTEKPENPAVTKSLLLLVY